MTAQVIPFAAYRARHRNSDIGRHALTLPILLPLWPWGFVWGRVTVEWYGAGVFTQLRA